jgi:hypothetical protein
VVPTVTGEAVPPDEVSVGRVAQNRSDVIVAERARSM